MRYKSAAYTESSTLLILLLSLLFLSMLRQTKSCSEEFSPPPLFIAMYSNQYNLAPQLDQKHWGSLSSFIFSDEETKPSLFIHPNSLPSLCIKFIQRNSIHLHSSRHHAVPRNVLCYNLIDFLT